MLNWLNRWKTEGQEELITPKGKVIVFNLSYKQLLVGILRLDSGKWVFEYTEEFKQQKQIKPLPDFPNVEKVYRSEELYPFFLHRIPSPKQPKVQEEIRIRHIDETDEVELLRLFGRKSISNPFLLRPV